MERGSVSDSALPFYRGLIWLGRVGYAGGVPVLYSRKIMKIFKTDFFDNPFINNESVLSCTKTPKIYTVCRVRAVVK